ncbi:MAG TPA: acyl-CoA dehydrogenase family protein [Polyangia bacterium]|nr:acyl-CoA dehydrogenase family protein [Polyangia bacterium]
MFDFTDEQKMIAQMVRKWAQAELAPLTDALEKNEILPYDLMRKMARTFGLPELARAAFERMEKKAQAGGQPPADLEEEESPTRDPAMGALVTIELSRINPGFCMSFGASVGLAGGAIMAKGTWRQKRRWALPVLTLEKIGAWGMTEPGAGSDAFGGMRTVARPDGSGGYVLSGQKTFITNAPYADTFVVYAKIDHGDGTPLRNRPIHAFVLERGMPGFETSKPMAKMGMHTSPTGELFIQDVRVERDRLLGEVEKETQRESARDVFHGERTGMAPMCLGIIERCLEDSIAYARQRTTWDAPIASYQLIQEKLARMFTHRENVRNILFKDLWSQQKGVKVSMAEACSWKLYCARAATECAMEAVQLMGGNGYMREFRVEQLARDAKLLQIGGGTDEIQIVTIARHLLKQ